MQELLTIRYGDGQETRVTLQRRLARVGSADACEIKIPHAEVAPHAATVDYRGGVYLLQNLNPYPVYLGAEAVPSEKWVPWPVGHELRLTRSVSIRLDAGTPTGADSSGASTLSDETLPGENKSRKNLIQIIIIVACVLLGGLMLTSEEAAPAASSDSFDKLVQDLAGKKQLSYQEQVVLRYLQEAYMADRRSRGESKQAVVRAYQLLMRHPLISKAPSEGTSIESRIKQFASKRLAAIDVSSEG